MSEFFPKIKKIKFEGMDSKNPFAFKHYNPKQRIMGKTMAEHLRFAVCYWHTFKNLGTDQFGADTIIRKYNRSNDPMQVAEDTMQAAFEFLIGWLYDLCVSVAGEINGRRFFPVVATIFLFVGFNAWLALCPASARLSPIPARGRRT